MSVQKPGLQSQQNQLLLQIAGHRDNRGLYGRALRPLSQYSGRAKQSVRRNRPAYRPFRYHLTRSLFNCEQATSILDTSPRLGQLTRAFQSSLNSRCGAQDAYNLNGQPRLANQRRCVTHMPVELKYAWRGLLKSPSFAVTAGLLLGMAATRVLGLIVYQAFASRSGGACWSHPDYAPVGSTRWLHSGPPCFGDRSRDPAA